MYLSNCITHDIKTCNNGCSMHDHWIKDLSNCITDDLKTCNKGGLRQNSVYLWVFSSPEPKAQR